MLISELPKDSGTPDLRMGDSMDAPPADLPDVAQAPPEKVVAYLRYLGTFLIIFFTEVALWSVNH